MSETLTTTPVDGKYDLLIADAESAVDDGEKLARTIGAVAAGSLESALQDSERLSSERVEITKQIESRLEGLLSSAEVTAIVNKINAVKKMHSTGISIDEIAKSFAKEGITVSKRSLEHSGKKNKQARLTNEEMITLSPRIVIPKGEEGYGGRHKFRLANPVSEEIVTVSVPESGLSIDMIKSKASLGWRWRTFTAAPNAVSYGPAQEITEFRLTVAGEVSVFVHADGSIDVSDTQGNSYQIADSPSLKEHLPKCDIVSGETREY